VIVSRHINENVDVAKMSKAGRKSELTAFAGKSIRVHGEAVDPEGPNGVGSGGEFFTPRTIHEDD